MTLGLSVVFGAVSLKKSVFVQNKKEGRKGGREGGMTLNLVDKRNLWE